MNTSTNPTTEIDFTKLLIDLVELDYNAVEAYMVAVDKLKNENYKTSLGKFQQDHERHIKEINEVLLGHGQESVRKPTAKQWITKGKVALANIMGDDLDILKAMYSIEEESNKAYEKANRHRGVWQEVDKSLEQGLEDEKKHIKWIEATLKNE